MSLSAALSVVVIESLVFFVVRLAIVIVLALVS